MFEEAFGRILDIPVAPFREHASDGVIDLGEAIVGMRISIQLNQ